MLLTHIHDFADTVFIAVAALLPIVDPLGGTPIYLAMISGLMPPERARMAKLVALNSFAPLLASMTPRASTSRTDRGAYCQPPPNSRNRLI